MWTCWQHTIFSFTWVQTEDYFIVCCHKFIFVHFLVSEIKNSQKKKTWFTAESDSCSRAAFCVQNRRSGKRQSRTKRDLMCSIKRGESCVEAGDLESDNLDFSAQHHMPACGGHGRGGPDEPASDCKLSAIRPESLNPSFTSHRQQVKFMIWTVNPSLCNLSNHEQCLHIHCCLCATLDDGSSLGAGWDGCCSWHRGWLLCISCHRCHTDIVKMSLASSPITCHSDGGDSALCQHI